MPKTIRWIGICALLLLAVLSLYRIGIYQLFPDVFNGAKKNAAQAFWFGFRFDVRLVAAISLFMIAISFWPGLHFFKWEGGKKIALFLYGFFATLILLFCLFDIGYLHSFGMRLQGTLIGDIAKGTEKWSVFKSKTPWMPLSVGIVVLVWLFVFLIDKLHKVINKSRTTDHRTVRSFWQIVMLLICIITIYGRLAMQPLSLTSLPGQLPAAVTQLAANPFESLLSSLPAMKKTVTPVEQKP